ncbi:carboxypeptidase B2-like [Actinia tenebrosa]|uniref:Carboxypeptidase B2-like n=1 Tax=Actinia tenebrosa TaxID=6105 RepID=A0A6P8HJQ7_ACTTE|nr:carboxypeptidase B2-like [Actinia tenebrosa]
MWFIPWGHTKNKTKDYQEQMRVAELACRAIKESDIAANYSHGQSSRLMYGASGVAEDWVYGNLGVRYSFSVELRDTGHYGFLLPARFIRQSGAEMLKALNAIIMAMKL